MTAASLPVVLILPFLVQAGPEGDAPRPPIRVVEAGEADDGIRVTYIDQPRSPWLVQIGAYASRDLAEQAWAQFIEDHEEVARGASPALSLAERDDLGPLVRLRVDGYDSREAAVGMCETLREAGGDCFVVRR